MSGLRSFLVGLALSLVLAGCGQGVLPQVQAPTAVSGTVQNWQGGTARIEPLVTDETGTQVLWRLEVNTTLSEQGRFQLTLPATVPSDLLVSEPICQGSFQGTLTPDSWGEFFAEMGVFEGGQYTGVLIQANAPDVYQSPAPGDVVVSRLFVDRDVTVEGTCTEEGFTQEYDAQARAGWNYVVFEVLGVAEGFPNSLRITTPVAIPAGVDWYFIPVEGAALR